MEQEELVELHALNVGVTVFNSYINSTIDALTSKALLVKLPETDRLSLLIKREGLIELKEMMRGRHNFLIQKKKKEDG